MTVPSATSRTNEAAERLRDNLHAIGGSGDDVFALLDAALSEERRLTVERIRERLDEKWPIKTTPGMYGGNNRFIPAIDGEAVRAILDEVPR